MLQKILELFTTEQKAALMLENTIIEMIFMSLFILFIVTVIFHVIIYFKLKKIRNYLKETNRMDIEPLQTFKADFETRQADEAFKTETFVQEKFSSWRIFGIPIIGLIKLIQMTISVFILLGVLGTFIGLTISLGSINGADEQLIENVSAVLSGIDIAFYTSIVGMSFSLIMTILVKVCNTEFILTDTMLLVESHLESHEQYGMHRVITVSEMIHESLQGVVSAFDGFKDYTSGLKESARDLALFNEGLSNNLNEFQTLFHQMKEVTDGFGVGTKELNKNFGELFIFFKKADQKNERIINTFEKTSEQFESIAAKQLSSFTAFDERVVDLAEFTTKTVNEQAIIAQSVSDISQETRSLVETMQAEKNQLQQIFGTDLSSKLERITLNISELKTGFDTFGRAISPLPQALEMIQHTQQAQNSLMDERIHDLKTFNQTYNEHLKDQNLHAQTFERNIRETAISYEQMTSKNNQLLTEIGSVINRLEQTFSKRDGQLESNVNMVKDTFTNYVTTLEGGLGQKLDTLIRNIDNSMYSQQDEIKRDFIEMRRMSEEINDNQVRAIQQLLRELTKEVQNLNRHQHSNQSFRTEL